MKAGGASELEDVEDSEKPITHSSAENKSMSEKSVCSNVEEVDNILEQKLTIRSSVRAKSRKRKKKPWYMPSRIVDHLVHVNPVGKLVLAALAFLTSVNYGKDLYVLYHLAIEGHWECALATLFIMVLSLRLMAIATIENKLKPKHLPLYWFPTSMYFDYPRDNWTDVLLCIMWELLLLLAVPLFLFYLFYIAVRKAISLFSGKPFRGDHALAFAVIESVFETIPQLIFQTWMYYSYDHGERYLEFETLEAAMILGAMCALRLPVILWLNRRIVYMLEFKRHHKATVSCVDFCRDLDDEDIIATGSWDGTVIINKIVEGQCIKAKRCIPVGYPVNDVKFLSGKELICVAGYVIELFNWRTGQYEGQIPKMDSDIKKTRNGRLKMLRGWTVKAFSFSEGNKYVAAAMGAKIVIYSIEEREKTCEVMGQRHGPGEVCTVAFSACGTILASGGFENCIKLWRFDPSNGQLGTKCYKTLSGHDSIIRSLCWGPPEHELGMPRLVSGSDDCTVILWHPTAEKDEQIHQFKGHEKEVTSVAFSQNGAFIVSGSRDQSMRLWSASGLTCEKYYSNAHNETITSLAIGPFDDMIVTGSEDQSRKLYCIMVDPSTAESTELARIVV